MKKNLLMEKSKAFALRIIKMYRYLCEERREFVLSKQVLRSGTSIGSNVAESIYAQSDADFVSKLCISRKEASETLYWIDLLKDSKYLEEDEALSIAEDCNELLKLLTSSIRTMQKKITKY